jgi:hypothetical protein
MWSDKSRFLGCFPWWELDFFCHEGQLPNGFLLDLSFIVGYLGK